MYTAVYKRFRQGYVAWIEEIPGVNTQASSKREAGENLRDALREFLLARRALTKAAGKGARGVVRERLALA